MPENKDINAKAMARLEELSDELKTRISHQQEQLARTDRLLAHPDCEFTYHVKTISLWANEGEVPAEARSKHLKSAIKKAGKRHHVSNKRSDWQVQWEVRVAIGAADESILFPLPPEIYAPLLPGE
jgi:hypothetical protein